MVYVPPGVTTAGSSVLSSREGVEETMMLRSLEFGGEKSVEEEGKNKTKEEAVQRRHAVSSLPLSL